MVQIWVVLSTEEISHYTIKMASLKPSCVWFSKSKIVGIVQIPMDKTDRKFPII